MLRPFFMHGGDGGLSRKAPSNARGDDPFLGGFLFGFFRTHPRGGADSNILATTEILCGFSLDFDRKPLYNE